MEISSSECTLLPFDLVEEILCKILIEYLIRFRLVCKEWYSLFKSKRFIYTYSDLVQERFIRIDKIVQIINPITKTRLISPMPDEFDEKPWISKLLHCDGLLLLKFSSKPIKNQRKLAVWNPILGQIKWIQFQPRVNPGKNKTYGIGYNNASDYKILRFFDGIHEDDSEIRESYEVNLEIYDLKSNSWSTIDVSLDWSRDLSCKGVSVNGNMYWKAQWNSNTNPKLFIQSFDFSSQTFKPRSCTLPFESCMYDTISLSCFRRDKLSLLHQFEETKKIEVWISNKVNEEVSSWSKYLSFASPDLPLLNADFNLADPGYFIDKNDKIRIWCNEMTEDDTVSVCVYEIGKDGIKREVEIVDTEFFFGYVYVPSLVPLTG